MNQKLDGDMIAFCGLDCSVCGAYLATINEDDNKRAEVAAAWSIEYNTDLKAEEIYCEGCRPGGKVYFGYCSVCKIRKCGTSRGIQNCAYCDDYPCSLLADFLSKVPEAKSNLETIRAGLS
jgi:hypothetical protein